MLRYVDEAVLSPLWKWLARAGTPIAAILIPMAFFLSVVSPTAKEPNALINLAYVGAAFLASAVLALGVGLIRSRGLTRLKLAVLSRLGPMSKIRINECNGDLTTTTGLTPKLNYGTSRCGAFH